jgi:hypothetical protein
MKNIKNLNEEINRIKSLFGEQRLYGNLVDETTDKYNESTVILEQAKPIAQFLESLINSIKSSGKSRIASNIDGVRTTYKISREGDIFKNGKRIDDLTNITNFISEGLNKRMTRQIDQIASSPENLAKYLSGEGVNGITLEKHINEIIDDLYAQRLINEGTAQKFKNSLKSTNIFQSISDIFKNADQKNKFINGINSDLDFGKNYPEIYELFNNIPNLKKNFYRTTFGEGKLVSDEYDSFITISDIIKKFKGKDSDGSDIIPWNSYFDSSGNINLEYDSINKNLTLINSYGQKLPSNLEKNIRSEIQKIKNINPDVDIKLSNNGNITFSVKNIKSNEIKNIDQIINKGAKIPVKIDSSNVPVITKSIDFDVDDILQDSFLTKKGDTFTQYYGDWIVNILKSSKVGISDILNNPTIIKMRDIFTTKMSRFLDPNYLRKNGYISTNTKGPKQIDSNWQTVLNSLWEVDTPIKGTNGKDIFIKTEEESLLYGIQIGGIKPNLVKKSDWSKTLKDEYQKTFYNIPFGLKGDYRNIAKDKLVRNFVIQVSSATTLGNLLYNFTYYKLLWLNFWIERSIENGKEYFIKMWKSEDVNPTKMLPLVIMSYKRKCEKNLKDNIISVFGNSGEAIFDTYFGPEGALKDIAKIIVSPTRFNDVEYNNTDKLPKLESVVYNINNMNLDGKEYKDFGTIVEEGDSYYLITIPIDDKVSKIPLNCKPDFDTFWLESWKEIYELKNNDEALEKKIKEIGEGVDWEKLSQEEKGSFFDEVKKSIDEITFKTITDGIETTLETVKDTGEEAEELLQDKLPDGGSGGGMGEFGEF